MNLADVRVGDQVRVKRSIYLDRRLLNIYNNRNAGRFPGWSGVVVAVKAGWVWLEFPVTPIGPYSVYSDYDHCTRFALRAAWLDPADVIEKLASLGRPDP